MPDIGTFVSVTCNSVVVLRVCGSGSLFPCRKSLIIRYFSIRMMATKFIVFALLFVACSYASPLRMATIYDSPIFVVPIIVQDLDIPQSAMDEEAMYALSDSKIAEDTANSIEKRSVDETDDLETAAGTNVLRPLFVYRQQVAYRQRARENAIRRGRQI